MKIIELIFILIFTFILILNNVNGEILGDSCIAPSSDVDEGIYGDGGTWRWHSQKVTLQTGNLTNISYWTQLGGTGGQPVATELNFTIWTSPSYPTLGTKLCDFAQVPNTIGWSTTTTFRNISGNCAITYEGQGAIVLSSDQTVGSANNQFEKGRTGLSCPSRNNAYGGPYGGDWNQENYIDPFALWYADPKKPTIIISNPLNNTFNHSLRMGFDFNISDIQNDKINYSLWVERVLNPNVMINSSNNTPEGNFSFIYTFPEIDGSINGTYYWKVNGTDNNSNNFTSSIYTFNITNNLDNITNVSINNTLPDIGYNLKGYWNLTSLNSRGTTDYDNCSKSWTRWYINKTNIGSAENNSILLGGNTTLLSNITFSARCNDGYGETSWTDWKNSTTLTTNDIINPTILYSNFSSISIVDGTQVNISVNATDNNFLKELNVTIKSPKGVLLNRSCQNLNVYSYICNTTLFDGDETSDVGIWNLTMASAMDTSNNLIMTFPNTTMEVISSGGGGNGASGGGGGGGVVFIEPIKSECNIQFFPNYTTLSKNNVVGKLELINNEPFTLSPTFIINRTDLIDIRGELEKIISQRTTMSYSIVLYNISVLADNLNISEDYFDSFITLKTNECKNIIANVRIQRKFEIDSSIEAIKKFFNEEIAPLKLSDKTTFSLKFYQVFVSLLMITTSLYSRAKDISRGRKFILIFFTSGFIMIVIKIFVDLVK